MTCPMPPELLEQLGLEPCAEADPQWPEDHDALGWGSCVVTTGELGEPAGRDQLGTKEERPLPGRALRGTRTSAECVPSC